MANRSQFHKDVTFTVQDKSLARSRHFKTFDEAAGFAVGRGVSHGEPVTLDVLVWSRAGAKWVGGDDAVEIYNQDPDGSVHERLIIKVSSQGRIP